MALTKRTYPSVIRVELDHEGKTVNRQVHRRTEVLDDGVVIHSVDARDDSMDVEAFQAELTEQYAAAVAQVEGLVSDKVALTAERDAALADKATAEQERDDAVSAKDAMEAAKP